MKKLYLSICLAVAGLLTMQARELTFYIGETPIADGQSISFTDIIVNDNGDYSEVKMAPDLYLGTDIFSNEVNMTATCTSGQEIQLCAGGACKKGVTVEKTGLSVSPSAKLALDFEYIAELDAGVAVPTVTATIEAQDGDRAETKKAFTIVMSAKAGSITLIAERDDLRFTRAGIEYSLDAPADFALYTADGLRVLSTRLSGSGTLVTDGMAEGIYVYTLGNRSGKIYIK